MSEHRTRAKSYEQSELLFIDEITETRPRWEDLSHEARRSVTELFARMLRQHRRGKPQSVAREVDHE